MRNIPVSLMHKIRYFERVLEWYFLGIKAQGERPRPLGFKASYRNKSLGINPLLILNRDDHPNNLFSDLRLNDLEHQLTVIFFVPRILLPKISLRYDTTEIPTLLICPRFVDEVSEFLKVVDAISGELLLVFAHLFKLPSVKSRHEDAHQKMIYTIFAKQKQRCFSAIMLEDEEVISIKNSALLRRLFQV